MFPKELTQKKQWVCWRLEPDPDGGKPRKVPYNAVTGYKAQSNNPKSWSDYATAADALEHYGYTGIGYMFVKSDNIVGVDIDHCYNPETGKSTTVEDMTYNEWKEKYLQDEKANFVSTKYVNSTKAKETSAIKALGNIDVSYLNDEFGEIKSTEIIITNERINHIKERHPQDYKLFVEHAKSIIKEPDMIIKDLKNDGTIFMLRNLEDTNLNMIVRLALVDDNSKFKNSIISFYRIRNKNLEKLKNKNKVLYKKE